jgi:hypothetical protein
MALPVSRNGFFTAYTFCDLGDDLGSAIFNFPVNPCVGNGAVENWVVRDPSAAAPVPASWAVLIAGLGLVGAVMRRRAALAAGTICCYQWCRLRAKPLGRRFDV